MKVSIIFYFLTLSGLNCDAGYSYGETEWNVFITNQSELDQFVEASRLNHSDGNCIFLSLVGYKSYTLDIVDFMNVTSFLIANSGSLIVQGVDGRVEIDCVSSQSDVDELLQLLQPISNALLVIFNELVFINCPVPVLIEEVSTVIIENCLFLHHEHGALNIFNSPNVTVKNCTFHNNTSSSYFTRKLYQGNAGGLSISYNMRFSNRTVSSIDVLVTDCVFTDNHAAPPTALRLSSIESLALNIFAGRGGALAMPINTTSFVNCVVMNNIFINNSAHSFGGCIYTFVGGSYRNHTFLFASNMFIKNSAGIGGVISLIQSQQIPDTFFLHATVQNCTFIQNRAKICGCVNYYPHLDFAGDLIRFIDCKFYNNSADIYAGAIDIVSFRFFGSRVHQEPIQLTNCQFDGNIAPSGAAINVGRHDARLNNVSFYNHQGSAIRVISGKITLHNSLKFYNNDAGMNDGGALYLISFSQAFIEPETHLDFVNNTGRFGAAIVVKYDTVSSLFERSHFNPLCFFQYSDSSVPSSQWDNVTINFVGNQALVGSAIYTSGLGLCSWVSYSAPYFNDNKDVFRWPLITYGDGNINTGHSRTHSVNRSLAVQTPPVNFAVQNKTIKAYPGELLNISMFSYDEQNFTTPDTVQIIGSNNDSTVLIKFSPSARTLNPSEPTFAIKFSIETSRIISNKTFNESYLVNVSALRTHSMNKEEHLNLIVTSCPPGLALYPNGMRDEFECRCNDENDQNIIRCQPDEGKIILKEGYWAHDISFGSPNGTLQYYWCPPGYCRCISNNVCNSVYHYDNNDLQCVCDRKGYLCGKCSGGKGNSVLLNKCVSCGYVNTLLIAGLVIVDVVVIVVILLSSITLQSWLHPFLFYLQVIPYIAEYFPVTFSAIQPYLYYISSALSLYFPYDFCLYPGMSALASYGLRYIPFLLTLSTFTIIYIVYSKCRVTVSFRLLGAGLWLLIMLQFTNIVATSVSILNCPMLKGFDGRNSLRWYIDGTVECFTGGHTILASFAILVLIVCIVLIATVMAIVMGKPEWPLMQRILRDDYKDHCKWFAPVELFRRLLLLILLMVDPGNLEPVLLLIMIYLGVYMYTQPYQKFYINILETVTLIFILIMLIIVSTRSFEHSVFGQNSNFDIDHCGEVNTISKYAATLIPLYYFPLVILVILIVKKTVDKILTIRSPQQQEAVNAIDMGELHQQCSSDTSTTTVVTCTEVYITDDDKCECYQKNTYYKNSHL